MQLSLWEAFNGTAGVTEQHAPGAMTIQQVFNETIARGMLVAVTGGSILQGV